MSVFPKIATFVFSLMIFGCNPFLSGVGGENQPCSSRDTCRGDLLCVAGLCLSATDTDEVEAETEAETTPEGEAEREPEPEHDRTDPVDEADAPDEENIQEADDSDPAELEGEPGPLEEHESDLEPEEEEAEACLCDTVGDCCDGSFCINEGGLCDNGQYCLVDSVCDHGLCMGGEARDCSEAVTEAQCQAARCNEDANQCESIPIHTDEPCDDGLYCTENEACQADGSCSGGDARSCPSGGNECMSEPACDEGADACTSEPINNGGQCEREREDGTGLCGGGQCLRFLCDGEDCAERADASIVVDAATGLAWQRFITDENHAIDDALAFCRDLELGDHFDWRLPHIKELSSLADFDRNGLMIDSTVFPDEPSGVLSRAFWTQTNSAEGASSNWVVTFQPYSAFSMDWNTDTLKTRCVRAHGLTAPTIPDSSTAQPFDLPMAFQCSEAECTQQNAAETVFDANTQLYWQRNVVSGEQRDFATAAQFCEEQTWDDAGGWRLPTVWELLTIIDYGQGRAAINDQAFPDTPLWVFWAAPRPDAPATHRWLVDFEYGSIDLLDTEETAYVRCVLP